MKKVVIIGIGHLDTGSNGLNHFKEWHALSLEDLVKIHGICRKNEAKLADTSEYIYQEYNQNPITRSDYREVIGLTEPDIVSVCTPDDSHYKIAKFALRYGAHVVVEKPMALTRNDAIDLARIANDNQRYIQLGTNFCYVKERLPDSLWDNSNLIEFEIEFKGMNKDIIYNTVPHIISMIPDKYDVRFEKARYVGENKNKVIVEGKLGDRADLVLNLTHSDKDFKGKKIIIKFDNKKYDLSRGEMRKGKYYTILKKPDEKEEYIPNMRRRLFRDLLERTEKEKYNGPFVWENGVRNTRLTCDAKQALDRNQSK
nr:Gfo/Idh/MocA family oxidoreductase [Nanoarchaeota archaeon]